VAQPCGRLHAGLKLFVLQSAKVAVRGGYFLADVFGD